MKRRMLLLLTCCIIGIGMVMAQTSKVTGKVLSEEDGEAVIGATVMVKGTNIGTVTDADGLFSLSNVPGSAKELEVSYVGMEAQIVRIQPNLTIRMRTSSEMLDEVLITGTYGSAKKLGSVVGSVAAVKSEKISNRPSANFADALQGQVAGLQVFTSSGEPSENVSMRMRGVGSINSSTEPLFILDGVPISSADFNTISPGDIESISVLKDASSTSIYGARAANGVVVITSKRGLAMDKAKVTLRGQWGFSQLASNDNWMMMNTPERIQFEKEIGQDTGKDYNLLSRTNINWLDEVFNDRAPLQSYELSVNRATDRLNYYVSGGFYDQDGIAQSSTFRRYNMRANAEVKASNWLKIGTNTMMAYEEIAQAEEGDMALYTPISGSRFMLPYWIPYNAYVA